MPRYLWKTVQIQADVCYDFPEGMIARSANDPPPEPYGNLIAWYRPKVRGGWRLNRWRKVKRAVLCVSGFHGNRLPQHAMHWGYGLGLALIEVRGDSARRRHHYNDHSGAKECYTEARIVALWHLTAYDCRYSIIGRTPALGAIPADYKPPRPGQYMYKTKIRTRK